MHLSTTALAVGVYGVRDRYRAAQRTSLVRVEPFESVNITGGDIDVIYEYEPSDTYQVGLRYLGKNEPAKLRYTIEQGVLKIDASNIKSHECNGLCMATGEFKEIVIRAPKLNKVLLKNQIPLMPIAPYQHFNADGY
jgi:hypothetical protein